MRSLSPGLDSEKKSEGWNLANALRSKVRSSAPRPMRSPDSQRASSCRLFSSRISRKFLLSSLSYVSYVTRPSAMLLMSFAYDTGHWGVSPASTETTLLSIEDFPGAMLMFNFCSSNAIRRASCWSLDFSVSDFGAPGIHVLMFPLTSAARSATIEVASLTAASLFFRSAGGCFAALSIWLFTFLALSARSAERSDSAA